MDAYSGGIQQRSIQPTNTNTATESTWITKEKYQVYHSLIGNSGFGWDEQRQIPSAPESVWEEYLRCHPEANEFRSNALSLCEELHEVFSDVVATGRYAMYTAYDSDDQEDSGPRPPRSERNGEEAQLLIAEPNVSNQALGTRTRGPSSSTPTKCQRTTRGKIADALQSLADDQMLFVHRRAPAQVAIEDFTTRYEETMTGGDRLRFATHVTANPSIAEMFNVLDSEAKEEYVLQFFNN